MLATGGAMLVTGGAIGAGAKVTGATGAGLAAVGGKTIGLPPKGLIAGIGATMPGWVTVWPLAVVDPPGTY